MKWFVLSLIGGVLWSGAFLPVFADEKQYTLKDLQALTERKAWNEVFPHLKDVPPAQRDAAWNRVVEAACLQSGRMEDYLAEYCLEPVQSIVSSEPTNHALAWKAGKWARVNRADWVAVPFFAKSVQKGQTQRCNDEDVQLATIGGLSQSSRMTELVVQSRTLAFETCWPAMKPALQKAFADADAYFIQNACASMKQKKLLTPEQAKKCAS